MNEIQLDPMGEYHWSIKAGTKHYKIARLGQRLNTIACACRDDEEDVHLTNEMADELDEISCDMRTEIAYLDGWRRDIGKDLDDIKALLCELIQNREIPSTNQFKGK